MCIKAVAACTCGDGTFFCYGHYFSSRKNDDDVSGSVLFWRKKNQMSRHAFLTHPPHLTPSIPTAVNLVVLVNFP
jgi:hypothetical protein